MIDMQTNCEEFLNLLIFAEDNDSVKSLEIHKEPLAKIEKYDNK
jgi:hypothetical protein